MLLRKGGLDNQALGALAEIVHDIDIKDGKYNRPETPGIKQLLDGLVATQDADEERLERGFALFDDLYAALSKDAAAPKSRRQRRTMSP
jgi:hypothetical protein